MPTLYATLLQIVHDPGVISILLVPLILIPLDLATGVARAIKTHKFSLRRATDFAGNDLMKYLGIFGFIVFIWMLTGQMTATAFASLLGMGGLSISIGSSILENIATLNLPPIVTQEATQFVKGLETIAQMPLPQVQDIEGHPTLQTPAISVPIRTDPSPYTKMLSTFTGFSDRITAPMAAIKPEPSSPLVLRPSPASLLSYTQGKELIL